MPNKKPKKSNKIKFWEVYNRFKTIDQAQEWDFKTKREFVKNNLFPKFKGKTKRYLKDVEKVAIQEIANLPVPKAPEEEFYNILQIPQANLSNIQWFDIDDFISTELKAMVMPKDILVEVNAGDMGTTGIFKLSEYNYQVSRLSEIVEYVREQVVNESGSDWSAIPVVLEGKQDDGKAGSYYLQFTVSINGEEVPPTTTPTYATTQLPEETAEQRKAKRKDVLAKKKELKGQKKDAEKLKRVKKAPLPTQKTAPESTNLESQKMRSDSIDKQMAYQKELLADAERLYRDKILTKKEFLAERKLILEQTNLAISKFEKGGKV
jgi:hypothetical protein